MFLAVNMQSYPRLRRCPMGQRLFGETQEGTTELDMGGVAVATAGTSSMSDAANPISFMRPIPGRVAVAISSTSFSIAVLSNSTTMSERTTAVA